MRLLRSGLRLKQQQWRKLDNLFFAHHCGQNLQQLLLLL
jgi:hypothetical protein